MDTDSSRVIDNDEQDTVFTSNPTGGSPNKRSTFTELCFTNESFNTKSSVLKNNQENTSNLANYSTSENSVDKDVFVIYQDSDTTATTETKEYVRPWSNKRQSDVLVEAFTIHPNKYTNTYYKDDLVLNDKYCRDYGNSQNSFPSIEEKRETDNVKNKLKVNVPRVGIDSNSIIESDDRKSLDSYTMPINTSIKQISSSDVNINDDINISIRKTSLPNILDNDFKNVHYANNIIKTNTDKNILTHINTEDSKSINRDVQIKFKNSKMAMETKVTGNSEVSHHKLLRVDADIALTKNKRGHTAVKEPETDPNNERYEHFGVKYILDTIVRQIESEYSTYDNSHSKPETQRDKKLDKKLLHVNDPSSSGLFTKKLSTSEYKSEISVRPNKSLYRDSTKTFLEQSVMVKMDTDRDYENKINYLTSMLENTERDYKKKIEAIKMQYNNNIKSIINDHNKGVKTIQGIHEDTFQDIIKVHENEVENLRSMSIEAIRKAEKLEKENRTLKTKILDQNSNCLDEEPIERSTAEKKRRTKCTENKTLTKTNVEAFNVKPKVRSHGPCTCSLETNVSETIRKIFEQVDAEQRKMAEHTYIKYIANKIINDNVEALNTKELSFLHLKVCRMWKTKIGKEETLQKRIDSLETELMHKQLNAQQHIADLDREVTEERRRLQELREAVCQKPPKSRVITPEPDARSMPSVASIAAADIVLIHSEMNNPCVSEQRSAGDNVEDSSNAGVLPPRRVRMESNRAVLAKMDAKERREKKLYNDEPPTRLRRSHDRHSLRSHKKCN